MICYQGVSVTYGGGKTVLTDFSLEVGDCEIVALVGESGSGKTTAIRAAMGLLPRGGQIVEGDILLRGKSLLSLGEEAWRGLRGTELSMIFQDSGTALNPIRRIGSQFVEYIRMHEKTDKRAAYRRALEMLESMALPDCGNIMKSYPFQLSGGMRQRVGIAMAMTFRPRLLLADEPTSALDVTTQAQIVRQMMELRDKYHSAIILVTHNLGVAAYMADRILVMKDGRVVDEGDRATILRRPPDAYTRQLLAAVPALEGEMHVS